MKKFAALALAGLLCLGLAGCQLLPAATPKLSDEEVVKTLLDRFAQGDYEGLTPYIDADNPLHLLCSNAKGTGGMAAPCQAAIRQASDMTYTAQAVAGKEAWGTVAVTLSLPSHSAALHAAMAEALIHQVETGEDSFRDVPGWLTAGMTAPGEPYEESFELHVGSRDGDMVMDTNTNRRFFAMLCGGLKPYLKISLTTCTFPDGTVTELVAQGDELIAIFYQETVPAAGYTREELEYGAQYFEDTYSGVDGVYIGTEISDQGLYARMGVDLTEASSYTLNAMGLISDRLTAGSNGWISLDSTVSGFTRQGATCVTEDFRGSAAQ